MRWFRDLVVHGNSDALDKLIAAIESRLPQNWDRDLEIEKRFAHVADRRLYLFRCHKDSADIGFVLARYPDVISVEDVRLSGQMFARARALRAGGGFLLAVRQTGGRPIEFEILFHGVRGQISAMGLALAGAPQ
jgi:hypothetical protein